MIEVPSEQILYLAQLSVTNGCSFGLSNLSQLDCIEDSSIDTLEPPQVARAKDSLINEFYRAPASISSKRISVRN